MRKNNSCIRKCWRTTTTKYNNKSTASSPISLFFGGRRYRKKNMRAIINTDLQKEKRNCVYRNVYKTWTTSLADLWAARRRAEAGLEDGSVGRSSGPPSLEIRNIGFRIPGPSDWARLWASRNSLLCWRLWVDFKMINRNVTFIHTYRAAGVVVMPGRPMGRDDETVVTRSTLVWGRKK